jgi:membrane protein insertase Oxa1/YidC/SpoIIIJ
MFQIHPMLIHMRILLLLWYVRAARHLLGYGHLLHIWPSSHPPFYD